MLYYKSKYVYFISCGEFVKIGCAVSVKERLKSVQTGCPYPLAIVGAFESGYMGLTEQRVHEMFETYHYRGEWYKNVRQIKEFAVANTIQYLESAHQISARTGSLSYLVKKHCNMSRL